MKMNIILFLINKDINLNNNYYECSNRKDVDY